mmetsp:Transcript_57109/g.177534  ORF Transcript_57109/g.177534 Transcript_57109/m.177534 type:complete len:326 (-) Transcript_57109:474-1451(-)
MCHRLPAGDARHAAHAQPRRPSDSRRGSNTSANRYGGPRRATACSARPRWAQTENGVPSTKSSSHPRAAAWSDAPPSPVRWTQVTEHVAQALAWPSSCRPRGASMKRSCQDDGASAAVLVPLGGTSVVRSARGPQALPAAPAPAPSGPGCCCSGGGSSSAASSSTQRFGAPSNASGASSRVTRGVVVPARRSWKKALKRRSTCSVLALSCGGSSAASALGDQEKRRRTSGWPPEPASLPSRPPRRGLFCAGSEPSAPALPFAAGAGGAPLRRVKSSMPQTKRSAGLAHFSTTQVTDGSMGLLTSFTRISNWLPDRRLPCSVRINM